jgi:hypothetical protein
MMNRPIKAKLLAASLILVALFAASLCIWSQTTTLNRTLIVSGRSGVAPVIQKDGKSYVEIEALARLTNGSLSFKGTQITLTFATPAAKTPAPAAAPVAAATPKSAFSKDFLKASVEAMSAIREWRGALFTAIQNGELVTPDYLAPYQSHATTNIRLAFVAESTDADRDAFQLLNSQLANVRRLSDKVLAAHQNGAQNITSDDLKNDPLNQQILNCDHSLLAMAGSGQFQDDGVCR